MRTYKIGDLFTATVTEFAIRFAVRPDLANAYHPEGARDFEVLRAVETWHASVTHERCAAITAPDVSWEYGEMGEEIRVSGKVIRLD